MNDILYEEKRMRQKLAREAIQVKSSAATKSSIPTGFNLDVNYRYESRRQAMDWARWWVTFNTGSLEGSQFYLVQEAPCGGCG